ncbi:methyltransferase domain-containing protein [Pseudoduganella sp. FT26W]|uniref:Methyltransferase domain-containing protein n=1 Tax=Duganella aquatilis TaxID=2666082 RepID=A0A844D5N2_9BURK|nr:class I SAM-dependent methyltransferase [Duganella aquatilis]MRW82489.1 methyltransferase domain-containing protein [Duganella aquatilis]
MTSHQPQASHHISAPASPAAVACPVCSIETVPHDVVDFSKNCEEARQRFLPLAGWPIYYHRCPDCGFVLAPEFRQWSDQDFQQHIYNERYAEIDPDALSKRPAANADLLRQLFGGSHKEIRHLDYGGHGALSGALAEQGWDSAAYQPVPHDPQRLADLGKFNLISAFEVFQRAPDVNQLMQNLAALMEDECMVLFSTLLTDGTVKPNTRLTWWYAAPRNGHVSLYSRQSLTLLAEQHHLQFGSFNNGLHCLFNQLPAWAARLLTPKQT